MVVEHLTADETLLEETLTVEGDGDERASFTVDFDDADEAQLYASLQREDTGAYETEEVIVGGDRELTGFTGTLLGRGELELRASVE